VTEVGYLVLYAIGVLALLVFGLNLFVLAVGFARNDRQTAGRVPEPDSCETPDESWPVVTVQLPVYNEALVVAGLIDACAQLDYPPPLMEIQVLDDSTDETSHIAARRVLHWRRRGVDIAHIRRPARTGYKAGALENGLTLARGELIAIFDADFLPATDFLRRMVPSFRNRRIGMVQARWSHQNAKRSLLTRLQAFGIDEHFAVEQRVRNLMGWFMNFNGTAGIWRRTCIDDAGGWRADTLTEDLDLSYRAQLKGWKFVYRPDVTVPAEIPDDMNAFRAQQFRWTKGAAQTATLMLPKLWRSSSPTGVKLQGTFHLTAHFVYPFILLLALLHAPLLWLNHVGGFAGDTYFAALGIGLLGFAGFFVSQLLAQRELYADWSRRMLLFPVFMSASAGLAVSNGRGIFEALLRRESPFVRTPKRLSGEPETRLIVTRYRDTSIPIVAYVEVVLALYSLAGLVLTLRIGAWVAVPFQLVFVVGFGLVAAFTFIDALGARWRNEASGASPVRG
jgi:cellulose synthase/poly-beta-1,6-N-acetylglucosamine synthase-like glycosyltransferase